VSNPPRPGSAGPSGYTVAVADRDEIPEVQRLRHDVLAAQYGTHLPTLAHGLDSDEFDEHCDHLIVRHTRSRAIVGTCRMMTPRCAALTGGRFGDRTFDLSPLRHLDADLVEGGRVCVHPDHRQGAVSSLLWIGIGRYLRRTGHRYFGGCPWVPLHDGGRTAAGNWAAVRERYLAPHQYRIAPRQRLLDDGAAEVEPTALPPLLHSALRAGGWICAEPAYDPDAKVAVFYVLLSLDHMNPRYRRRFLDESVQAADSTTTPGPREEPQERP
jgi:putative hemolysin